MNACREPSPIDHYLVARVQACVTGANAHNLHALLGNYYELCLIADPDASLRVRVASLEQRLRAFCQSHGPATARSEPGYPLHQTAVAQE